MYASSWFLTLFLTFLPLPVATRIFDIFMYEVGDILCMNACLTVYIQFADINLILIPLKTCDPSVGPRDYLPRGLGHPAVQPDGPHSAGHGGHVAGKQLWAVCFRKEFHARSGQRVCQTAVTKVGVFDLNFLYSILSWMNDSGLFTFIYFPPFWTKRSWNRNFDKQFLIENWLKWFSLTLIYSTFWVTCSHLYTKFPHIDVLLCGPHIRIIISLKNADCSSRGQRCAGALLRFCQMCLSAWNMNEHSVLRPLTFLVVPSGSASISRRWSPTSLTAAQTSWSSGPTRSSTTPRGWRSKCVNMLQCCLVALVLQVSAHFQIIIQHHNQNVLNV